MTNLGYWSNDLDLQSEPSLHVKLNLLTLDSIVTKSTEVLSLDLDLLFVVEPKS